MPDHDLQIENQLFPNLRGDLNAALLALASNFAGNTAPSNPQKGMLWVDTSQTLKALKYYDAADWITLGVVDEVTNRFIPAGAVAGGTYVTSGGTADAISLTIDYPYTAYRSGMTAVFKANAGNTGPATLNINGLGPKAIKRLGGTADLQAGDIAAGAICFMVYDLTQDTWQLLNASFSQGAASESSSGAIEIATHAETALATDDQRAVTPRKLAARASGPFAIVATANSMDIETPLRYNIEATGSVDIFGFVAASQVGIERRIFFAGAPILRHSPSLFLAGQSDIQTASGDVATFVSVTSGWKMVNFIPVSGQPLKNTSYPLTAFEGAEDFLPFFQGDSSLAPARASAADIFAAMVMTQLAGGAPILKTNQPLLKELYGLGAIAINFNMIGGDAGGNVNSLVNGSGNFSVNGNKLDCTITINYTKSTVGGGSAGDGGE